MIRAVSAEEHPPNIVTIKNIKASKVNMPHSIVASLAAKLLLCRGMGSGLLRAFRVWSRIELISDRTGSVSKAIGMRPEILRAVNSGASVEERTA